MPETALVQRLRFALQAAEDEHPLSQSFEVVPLKLSRSDAKAVISRLLYGIGERLPGQRVNVS